MFEKGRFFWFFEMLSEKEKRSEIEVRVIGSEAKRIDEVFEIMILKKGENKK